MRDIEGEVDRVAHNGFVGSGSTGLAGSGGKSFLGGEVGAAGVAGAGAGAGVDSFVVAVSRALILRVARHLLVR